MTRDETHHILVVALALSLAMAACRDPGSEPVDSLDLPPKPSEDVSQPELPPQPDIDTSPGSRLTEAVLGATCAHDQRIGLVTLQELDGAIHATAIVHEAPNPWYGAWSLETRDCKLHEFQNGFCDPFCAPPNVCADDKCVPPPQGLSDITLALHSGGETQVFSGEAATSMAYGEVTLPSSTYAAELTWGEQTVKLAEMALPSGLLDLTGAIEGTASAPSALEIQWTPPSPPAAMCTPSSPSTTTREAQRSPVVS